MLISYALALVGSLPMQIGTGGFTFREGLGLPPIGASGRVPVHQDSIEYKIVNGAWVPPHIGDKEARASGQQVAWSEVKADKDGTFSGAAFNGGYSCFTFRSDKPQTVLLEAQGHSFVYVNGELRMGDPYSYGYLSLPIPLKSGDNTFLFNCGRGSLKARLLPPPKPQSFDLRDSTLPDFLPGESGLMWGAVVVRNATGDWQKGLQIDASGTKTKLPDLMPYSARKVGFQFRAKGGSGAEQNYDLKLSNGGATLDVAKISIRRRGVSDTYKRTFISDIDGSVQYYAVRPPVDGISEGKAMVLSLHGASVEATSQVDAYGAKTWATIVAPTNRRPFGFDWEDWGRLDAMEVLKISKETLKPNEEQIYLSGHSMGGHGTWQVGAHFPDQFAAIGPSAGWISFFSYGGGRRYEGKSDIEKLLNRAANPSDTLGLISNYAGLGVYILHGSADDNVPPSEAREMAKRLGEFHKDWQFFEQPGAGHWWESSDEPGAECMDWPQMYDFFSRHQRPKSRMVRQVDFVTSSPAVSANCYWLSILQQQQPFEFSKVSIRVDPILRRFVGTTKNVARLSIDTSVVQGSGDAAFQLDGGKVKAKAGGVLVLSKGAGGWTISEAPKSDQKSPARGGLFKLAFQHRFVFIAGTGGSEKENAWALSKARYDAEAFGYRGNGSVDVILDRDWNSAKFKGRSVILYGNAKTNSAWAGLLGSSPVSMDGAGVKIGSTLVNGSGLACLFTRPRLDDPFASVGVIGGTDLVGMRLCDRIPYFTSGVALPDCTVYSADTLLSGMSGVRATGFFGNDWSVEHGEWGWSAKP